MKLFEITYRKPQKPLDQTATADKPDLSTFRQAFRDNTTGNENVPTKRQTTATPTLRKASAASTRSKASQVNMPAGAAQKLSFLQSLGIQDEITDDEAAQRAGYNNTPSYDEGIPEEPKTPGTELATIENMPAIVNKEISEVSGIEPEWHQVKHLPGYLKSGIRAMGRQVFGTYTSTPIEDIQVLANLGGNGPNSTREMNAVLGWIRDNATRDTEGEMNFQQSIPDYNAEFKIFTHQGFTFMVVEDFAGRYIYSWPSADEKSNNSNSLGIEHERKRIR